MEPDTEVSIIYSVICHHDLAEFQKTSEALVRTWSFKCICPMCTDMTSTPRRTLRQREDLRDKLINMRGNFRKDLKFVEATVSKMEETYMKPAAEVPRPVIADILFTLQQFYMDRGDLINGINAGLHALESVGYVIEGGYPGLDNKLLIKKWGLVFVDLALIGCWRTLQLMYASLGKSELADQAGEYAKLFFKIRVGECETYLW